MAEELNGYNLTRAWFNWSFENPEKVSPNHTAIYCFAIEQCNRLGWKDKFGFPTSTAMEVLGIKKHATYILYFNQLVEWGFIKLVEKSVNQHTANIISLKVAMPKNGKALDKANIKATEKQPKSTGKSNSTVIKQVNNETTNKELLNKKIEDFRIELIPYVEKYGKDTIRAFFDYWTETSKKGKLRKEKQEFFDIKKRLDYWKGREKNNFAPTTQQPIAIKPKEHDFING